MRRQRGHAVLPRGRAWRMRCGAQNLAGLVARSWGVLSVRRTAQHDRVILLELSSWRRKHQKNGDGKPSPKLINTIEEHGETQAKTTGGWAWRTALAVRLRIKRAGLCGVRCGVSFQPCCGAYGSMLGLRGRHAALSVAGGATTLCQALLRNLALFLVLFAAARRPGPLRWVLSAILSSAWRCWCC